MRVTERREGSTLIRETVLRCIYPGHASYDGWERRYEEGPVWARTVDIIRVECTHDYDPGDEDRSE